MYLHGRQWRRANRETKMTQDIKRLLSECLADARREGFDGEWEPTAEAPEWGCAVLGRKPTREEWSSAGLKFVGGAHVEEVAQ